jgi:phytoene dehydrogenase-like protein
VTLSSGDHIEANIVASNADPKRTFLKLVDPQQLDDDFKRQVRAIHMDGPAAKVNLVLSEEPRVNGMPGAAPVLQKMLFTLVPTFEQAQRCYNASQTGELEPDLWVDCAWASALDPELATPGHHVLTTFVQYQPWQPSKGDWDQLFFMRPLPGWAHYHTPIEGLYLCGAGTHPGGGVTGAPGYNAAHKILKDKK